MRLFVAVELPEATVAGAAAVSAALRERVHRQAPRARLTWVAPERMHLTLRFIGEVDGGQSARIAGALTEPLHVLPFTVSLAPPGTFPGRGNARVIWMDFDRGRDELLALEQQVTTRLSREGIPPEGRPFSPHLTLARVRDRQGLRAGPLLEGVAVPADTGGVVVEAITLFESRLSPSGPAYTALQRTPFRRV